MSSSSPTCLEYDASACLALSVFSIQSGSVDEDPQQIRDGNRQDSLFSLISFTKSPMGSRLLKVWISEPQLCRRLIQTRQKWISAFIRDTAVRCSLRDSSQFLNRFPDLEKLGKKLGGNGKNSASLFDLVTIYHALLKLSSVRELLETISNEDSVTIREGICNDSGSDDCSGNDNHDVSNLKRQLTTLCDKFTNLMALVEEVVGLTELTGKSKAERALWGEKWIQVKPSFTPELASLHEKLQNTRALIEEERNRAAKLAGLDLKNFHLENSDVHGLHFRVTKKQANAALKKLNAADAPKKTTTLSVHSSGYLFHTHKLSGLINEYKRVSSLYAMEQERIVSQALEVAATYKKYLFTASLVIAKIDCLCALAHAAVEYDWCCPVIVDEEEGYDVNENGRSSVINGVSVGVAGDRMNKKRELAITGLRHPIVEAQVGSSYVSSDICLTSNNTTSRNVNTSSSTAAVTKNTASQNDDSGHCDYAFKRSGSGSDSETSGGIAIVTGPNMGGKSTFIRAVALCVILAQMGSYVPATSARLSIFDRIITRVGASDSTMQGVSTFMAEMLDVSAALRNATNKSLVVIDELGRGTSTHDGFGIAWAVLERFASSTKCSVLFATHFHELTSMDGTVPGVKNYHVKANIHEENKEISMMYQLFPGPSERSYGVAVAKLAQFPEEIIAEAEQIADELESRSNSGIAPKADEGCEGGHSSKRSRLDDSREKSPSKMARA